MEKNKSLIDSKNFIISINERNNTKVQKKYESKLLNLNFNLLKIIFNFFNIEEILVLLKIKNSKINSTFLEMNFIKIYKLLKKLESTNLKMNNFIIEVFKILRKENIEDKNITKNFIKSSIKDKKLVSKIEDELNNITNTQIKHIMKYLFILLFKEIKELNFGNSNFKNEDIENLTNILKNNDTIFSINFKEDNLNKKICAEYFENAFKTNFTLVKIPYFIYKNNSITNEFHIGINEFFQEINYLGKNTKKFLKEFFTENKNIFIQQEEFLNFIFYEFQNFEKIQEKKIIFTEKCNKFDLNSLKGKELTKAYNLQINDFDLYKLIKSIAIVYNRHLFFGVYFYLDLIEERKLTDFSDEKKVNFSNKSSVTKNTLNITNNQPISINLDLKEKEFYNKINRISFQIILKNEEAHLKMDCNILKIILEVSKVNFINLKYLDLKDIKLNDKIFKDILLNFNMPFLTHLILNNNLLTLENLLDLNIEELKLKIGKIEVINFDFNQITDKGFICLLTKFPLEKLKEFHMNVNMISAQNFGKSNHPLIFESLKILHFHNNKINDFGFLNILTKFKMPYITEMNFNKNQITGENLYKIQEINFEKLECFYLDENLIIDDGFSNILKKIKMPRLKRLFFNNNQITSEYLMNELADLDIKFKNLKIFNLKSNRINDKGFLNILMKFDMPKILELNFSENLIKGEILTEVANKNNKFKYTELKYLYLESNSINDIGFKNILSYIEFPKIKKLQFNKNKITAENTEIFPLLNLPNLEYFFLAENNISKESFENINKRIIMTSIQIFSIDISLAIDKEDNNANEIDDE